MKEKTLVSDFTKGSIPKQLVVFAAPLLLSSILQIVYNTVDMIIVGHKMGAAGLSGVAVGGDIANFITFFTMGFANAGQVIISQYIGAKRQDKLGKFVANTFSFTMICSVILSIICLAFRHPILKVMNTPKEAYYEALGYSTVSMIGFVFISGYNMTSAVLRGMGDSKHPLIFIAIASVLNIILDILLVIVIPMGATGAALATVISQGVSFILCGWFLLKHNNSGFEMKKEDFKHFDKSMISDLVKLGLPMAIKSASIHISKLFVNSWINSYGVAVSAFAGIANKINSISNLISNAANTAGSSMVGQNIGAEKYKRVPKIIVTIAVFTLSAATVLSLAMVIFPRQIFSVFTTDNAVLDVGMEYLYVAVLIFFGSACRAPANALLNGSGNYKINFATAIFDGIVMRIGLSILFGLVLNMKYIGFWLGDAVAGFTPLVIGIVFYLSGRWKKQSIK